MNSTLICGITSVEAYPRDICIENCKQWMEKIQFNVPIAKPDIEEINEIHVSANVEKVKMIQTVMGFKIVVEGQVHIKIIYTADNVIQSVHSAHGEKSFCEYILLGGFKECGCHIEVKGVFSGVEDVCIQDVGKRHANLGVLLILCPQICVEKISTRNQTCCCVKEVRVNQVESYRTFTDDATKIVESTRNLYDTKKEEEFYERESRENENRYYRKQAENDDCNVYRRSRRRGY